MEEFDLVIRRKIDYPEPILSLYVHNNVAFNTKEELDKHLCNLRIIGRQKVIEEMKPKTLKELNACAYHDEVYGTANRMYSDRYDYIGDYKGAKNVIGVHPGCVVDPTYYALDDKHLTAMYWRFPNEGYPDGIWIRPDEEERYWKNYIYVGPYNYEVIEILKLFQEHGLNEQIVAPEKDIHKLMLGK